MNPEQKKELKKKITAILTASVALVLVYSFYLNTPDEHKVRLVKNHKKSELKKNNKEKTEKLSTKKPKNQKSLKKKTAYIKPSNKNELIQLAILGTGKKDPFKNTLHKPKAPKFGLNNDSMLPSPDEILKNYKKRSEELSLKGFIGNKAIVYYKGVYKTLEKNQILNDITIIGLDRENLEIVYKKQGKEYKKQLKTIKNDDLQIIKKRPSIRKKTQLTEL